MRLKRLWSCNQRVLSYSMPAERVRDCEGESAFSPAGPTQDTKPPALMRGKNVKAFWLPELFNQSSISVSEPEKWLESSGLPEILSDCDCGMKWALCGVAAAAKFEMCGQKAIWEIIGCEFVTRVSKTSRSENVFKWKRCDGLRIWIGVRRCTDQTSLWWPCSKIQLKSRFCMDFINQSRSRWGIFSLSMAIIA